MFVALLIVVTTTAASGPSDSAPHPLGQGLVGKTDLPGTWFPFETSGQSSSTDLCGRPLRRATPQDAASIAWAITPDNGPIFGERLERYSSAGEVKRLHDRTKKLKTPCNWTNPQDGTRWRTVRLTAPRVGQSGQAFLVTSRDRTDSFNYEVTLRSADTWLHVVLNSRRANRALLDELVEAAWTKAKKEAGLLDG
ncbi:MAG: hypothetical protein ABWZ15_11315 [Acidimicrobiia bacterium]